MEGLVESWLRQKRPMGLEHLLCVVGSFANAADLTVESLISIFCGRTDVVVVKKGYVLPHLYAMKAMVAMR